MRLFINYRRDDTFNYVMLLRTVLQDSQRSAPYELYVDVDVMPPGRDYVADMTEAVRTSDVLLAVIGRHWPGFAGRLQDSADNVRVELRTAVESGIPLVAVLVDGGSRPQASVLPADIQALARAPIVELRDESFAADTARLTSVIDRFPRRSTGAPAPARLRLVTDGTGWLVSGDQYDVIVDGAKAGLLRSGAERSEFVVPPGAHAVQLRRGLRASEVVRATFEPGAATTLGYDIGLWKISLRPRPR